MVILRGAAGCDRDSGSDAIAVALRSFQREVQPMPAAWTVIDPNLPRSTQRTHHDIGTSIAVQVRDCRAAMPAGRESSQTRLASEGLKLRATQVAKHCVRLRHRRSRIFEGLHVTAR